MTRKHWIGIRRRWRDSHLAWQDQLVSIAPEDLKTHALLIGATGSGKTNLLHHLIAQDIRFGHSFCVLDLRGDLVQTVIELCAGRVTPGRIRFLDLREKERPLGFNPLFGAGEPYYRALAVRRVIEDESSSWGPQLAQTLENCLLLLAEGGGSLVDIERLLFDAHYRSKLLKSCGSEPVQSFWMRFDELSPERQALLATPVLNKISLLCSTKTLRQILSHPEPLDLGRHLNTPGSILLISLAIDELHGAGMQMGRIILSAICREVFARISISESRRNPLRLYIDEFEHFGMREIEDFFAEGRRFGCSLVLANQVIAQHSPRIRSLVFGCCGVKVAFRCGREDAAALSKDFTGDPRALDLYGQRTGEAHLWIRGRIPIPIEVNRPLIKDVGRQSLAGLRLHQAIRERNGLPAKPTPLELPAPSSARATRSYSPIGGLEDLL